MKTSLKVRDYMKTKVVTVTPNTEITLVISILIEKDISGLLVLDVNGQTVGIVTERDCIGTAVNAGYYDQLGGPVSGYMTTPVESVGPDDNLVDLAVRMTQSTFRRFPVLQDGKLVGIIGRRDVLRALSRHNFGAESITP
jgi:CBS domain-containing protein